MDPPQPRHPSIDLRPALPGTASWGLPTAITQNPCRPAIPAAGSGGLRSGRSVGTGVHCRRCRLGRDGGEPRDHTLAAVCRPRDPPARERHRGLAAAAAAGRGGGHSCWLPDTPGLKTVANAEILPVLPFSETFVYTYYSY